MLRGSIIAGFPCTTIARSQTGKALLSLNDHDLWIHSFSTLCNENDNETQIAYIQLRSGRYCRFLLRLLQGSSFYFLFRLLLSAKNFFFCDVVKLFRFPRPPHCEVIITGTDADATYRAEDSYNTCISALPLLVSVYIFFSAYFRFSYVGQALYFKCPRSKNLAPESGRSLPIAFYFLMISEGEGRSSGPGDRNEASTSRPQQQEQTKSVYAPMLPQNFFTWSCAIRVIMAWGAMRK